MAVRVNHANCQTRAIKLCKQVMERGRFPYGHLDILPVRETREGKLLISTRNS